MSTKLDNVIDNYVKMRRMSVLSNAEDLDDELLEKAKIQLKREIREEIEEEVKERALKKAQDEIEEKAGLRRIAEFRKLAMDGFIVAIFVGLFVNQVTELIGHFKKTSILADVRPTAWIAAILFLICVAIFACRFLAELIKLLERKHNDATD